MGDLNDEKLRELGEKLALFAEDVPIHWQVAPFQMHPVQEFVPSPAVLLQTQQQLQQQQFFQPAYYAPPAAVLPTFHQVAVPPQLQQSPFFASTTSTQTEQYLPPMKDMASSPKHQRVPSIGAIDSETNPIAASLLMSFKSILNDDGRSNKTEPSAAVHTQHSGTGHHSKTNDGHYHGHGTGKGHHVMLRPHYHSNNNNNGHNGDLTSVVQQPPPPPPPVVQPVQQSDSWSPYNGALGGSGGSGSSCDQNLGSRPKFSDVVKKSLSEVAANGTTATSATATAPSSRPVTPAPGAGNQPSTSQASSSTSSTTTATTNSVPPSPSLGTGQVVQHQQGSLLQNANFSLASSRSNLSRNGKPIVVAKVEPMQVSANRLAATQQQPLSKPQSSIDAKVRRVRSSTTGTSGGSGNGQAVGANGGETQGQFGSYDSVFENGGVNGNGNNSTSSKSSGNRRSGDKSQRMTTTSSMESHDSERDDEAGDGELLLFDDTTTDDLTMDDLDSVRQRPTQQGQRQQQQKTGTSSKKSAPKRGTKTAETGSSSAFCLVFMKIGAFLAQLGPWIVFFLAKTGSLFRFMLYLVVQGLGYVLGHIFDALKSVYHVLRRLFPAKVERIEVKLSYLALLRQYGLPRPISLPGSADATLKRLVQLADADAYTVLGCRYDAKQDDINVRLRQLARLLTQNHKKTQQLEEAGAVFRRICNDIGSREARQRYDCELVAAAEYAMKRRLNHHCDHHVNFQEGLLVFQCYDCGLIHQFFEVPERRQTEARACNRCGPAVLHTCDLNDLWAETYVVLTPPADTGDGGPTLLSPEHNVRYLTCLFDCTVFDASDAMPCCKSRFLAKSKLDPNCHTVGYKLELTPKIDEQGLPMRKLPNPTALQQADGDCWSIMQVYQVRMVAKFKHDSFNSTTTASNSSSKQYESSISLNSTSSSKRKKGAK